MDQRLTEEDLDGMPLLTREDEAELSKYLLDPKLRGSFFLARSTCEHLEKLKLGSGLVTYSKIYTNFVVSIVERSREIRSKFVKCGTCKRSDVFLASCLHCVNFGCVRRGHIRNHYKDSGHPLVCDLTHGTVYCFKCCDFLFDIETEAIAEANNAKADYLVGLPACASLGLCSNSPQLTEFLLQWGTPRKLWISENSTVGLRGLVNLGHTCFMNCIIQTLMHTPLLRDFFMIDRITCTQKHDQRGLKPCIITQFFDLFQEFYNGKKTAMSLHNLLYKIWGNATHLAGYEQQDAHEFFIAMLDALHQHFLATHTSSSQVCKCVVDLIFLGRLQSAVTCMVCGHKSITVDPFWDISLDIVSDNTDPKSIIYLSDCLTRYTRIEHLGSGGMIKCKDCDRYQESTKQLKFKGLPIILCLHLKRFEHSTNYKKIDSCVRFPERLDLTPFTASHEDSLAITIEEFLYNKNRTADCKYSLFAVVNHVGSLDGGHYYAYIRHVGEAWYKCDDHLITKASKDEVLASPGYLLFYHKDIIFYDDSVPCSSTSLSTRK